MDNFCVELQQNAEVRRVECRDYCHRNRALCVLFLPPILSVLLFLVERDISFSARFLFGVYFYYTLFSLFLSLFSSLASGTEDTPSEYALKHRKTERIIKQKVIVQVTVAILSIFYIPFFLGMNNTQIGSLFEAGQYKEIYYADVAYRPNSYEGREVHKIPLLIERCASDCEREHSPSHYHALYMVMPYDGPTPFVYDGMAPYDNIILPEIECYVPTEGEDCGYYITLSKERAPIK